MSNASRPQMTQDDSALGNRNQGSNAKTKGSMGGGNNRLQQMRQFKGGSNNYNGGAAATADGSNLQSTIKLPRTGIEQVFCGDRPRFIEAHREFERIAPVNVSTLTTPLCPIELCPPSLLMPEREKEGPKGGLSASS